MEFKRILFVILRKWWLLALLAVIGGGIGFLYVNFGPPRYQAEATLYIVQSDSEMERAMDYDDFALSKYLVEQYANIISTRTVQTSILREVGVDSLTTDDLNDMVELVTQEDSNLFVIRATGSDPEMVKDIADATANEFSSQLNRLSQTNVVGVLDYALVPNTIAPGYLKTRILFGVLLGLMTALGVIYVTEFLWAPIISAEDIEKGLDLRVIGQIPDFDID